MLRALEQAQTALGQAHRSEYNCSWPEVTCADVYCLQAVSFAPCSFLPNRHNELKAFHVYCLACLPAGCQLCTLQLDPIRLRHRRQVSRHRQATHTQVRSGCGVAGGLALLAGGVAGWVEGSGNASHLPGWRRCAVLAHTQLIVFGEDA